MYYWVTRHSVDIFLEICKKSCVICGLERPEFEARNFTPLSKPAKFRLHFQNLLSQNLTLYNKAY